MINLSLYHVLVVPIKLLSFYLLINRYINALNVHCAHLYIPTLHFKACTLLPCRHSIDRINVCSVATDDEKILLGLYCIRYLNRKITVLLYELKNKIISYNSHYYILPLVLKLTLVNFRCQYKHFLTSFLVGK